MPLIKLNATQGLTGTLPAVSGANLTNIDGGKVLQVKNVVDNTNRSSTSTSYAHISSFDLAITPSATSSKIFLSFSGLIYKGDNGGTGYLTFYRDSTDLSGSAQSFAINDGDNKYDGSTGLSFLDSPNTTSEVTYKVYVKVNSGTIEIVNVVSKGSLTLFEIGA